MNKKRLILTLLIVAIAIFIVQIPVTQRRILTRGIDSFATHRSVFGDHKLSQDIITQGAVTEVGAIFVNLYRADQISDVTIVIEDLDTQTTLTTNTIPAHAIEDDVFASVPLAESISDQGRRLRLHFSAPAASIKNPIGIRYHPDVQLPSMSRFEDDKAAPGTFAIQITEEVPVWRFLYTHITQNPDRSLHILLSLLITGILAALASRLGFLEFTPKQQKIIEYGAIIILILLALASRWHVIRQLGGVSGGDPYNYLYITDSLTHLQNPFAGVKRLPGYPLLLVPTYLIPQIDDQLAMRLISTLSSGGALFMLFLLARSLKLPWSVQLLAPALIAWQKDFLWISTRPEPYTLYAFLLLASLVLWFNQTTRWQQIAYGLVLGYAAMTRQEGFVLAAILGLASLTREIAALWTSHAKNSTVTSSLKKLAYSYIPALFLVLPFFLHNTITFGNPIYTPYFEGERLQIVDSYPAFQDALQATWGVLGSMYKTNWDQLERVGFSDGRFRAAAAGSLLWFFSWHYLPGKYRRFALGLTIGPSLLLGTYQLWTYLTASSMFTADLLPVTAGIIIVAAIPFLWLNRWPGFLLLLILVSQILIATWFHPFPKHYQQAYPLLALLVVTALIAPPLSTIKNRALPRLGTFFLLFPLIMPIPLLTFKLFDGVSIAIDDQNANTALDSVVYRATQAARALPGPHGFDQAYLSARLYFSDQAQYYTPENSTPDKEDSWLQNNAIKTLIVVNITDAFHNLPPDWQLIKTFKSAGKEEFIFESRVYQRP